MTNDYFNHVNNRVAPNTRALDSQINNIADEIALGFDKIPDESEIRGDTVNLATNIGSVTAMVATLSYTPSLVDGFRVRIRCALANSGATTLNLNSLGAINVRNSDRSELTIGAIAAGTISDLYYDQPNTQWILSSNNSAWGKPDAGAGLGPLEYCPGYTYVFIDTDEWRIVGFDVTNLFSVSRRLKFVDGVYEYFGTITASVYTGGNTDMTMSMEGGNELTNTIGEVCLTSGTTGWSAIATDPFDGRSINDICVGDIGANTWLFAVGDAGKCGVSSDGGDNWTMLTTGTPQDISSCVYDSINKTFWGGGEGGALISTSNATSITLDIASIPALAGTTSDDIAGFAYNSNSDELVLLYHSGASVWHTVSSGDEGATWVQRASLGSSAHSKLGLKSEVSSGQTGALIHAVTTSNTGTRRIDFATDTSFATGSSMSPHAMHAMGFFTAAGLPVKVLGSYDGAIYGVQTWAGDDDVTFSNKVNDFAYSSTHERLVCVGDNQQIGYWEEADRAVNDAWTQVSNGFNPLADIHAVVWDDTNAVFIAVADNGQICRSSNGTN